MAMKPFTLITGASSGIGRGVAEQFGASRPVILAGRNETRLAETARKCQSAVPPLVWTCDLEQTEEVFASLARFLEQKDATVDCFIHCAGTVSLAPMRLTSLELMRRTMSVNFFAACEIIRVLLKKRINRESLRSITLLSSIASEKGVAGYAAYSASKGAINSYVRSLAVELAPRVRVNAVLPGAIRTAGTEEAYDRLKQLNDFETHYPLGEGKVGDIVDVIEFMTSTKARWITGQKIVVDGGRTIV